jgi:hypothetical protein
MMAEPNTQETGLDFGVDEGALQIEGLLAQEEGDQEEPEKEAPKPAKEAAPEAPPEEQPEEPEGEPEPEAEPDGEGEPEPLYTVKIDGKEKQVPLSELTRGYSGQEWITQRSQAIAAEKKALEAEAAAVKQERAKYAQVLGQIGDQLKIAEPDWAKLRAEDEYKFTVEWAAHQVRQEQKAVLENELKQVQAAQQRDDEAAKRRLIDEENRKVLEAIPAWKDKDTAKKDIADLRAFGKSVGWTDEELDNATDHRAVRALWAEYQLSRIGKSNPRPVNRGPRVASPGSGTATPGRRNDAAMLKQRAAKTGTVEDAAAVFEHSGVFE